jgi:hypothetical protein
MPSEVVVSTDNDAVQRYLWLYHLRGVLAHGGEIALAMTVDLRLADIRGSLTATISTSLHSRVMRGIWNPRSVGKRGKRR